MGAFSFAGYFQFLDNFRSLFKSKVKTKRLRYYVISQELDYLLPTYNILKQTSKHHIRLKLKTEMFFIMLFQKTLSVDLILWKFLEGTKMYFINKL